MERRHKEELRKLKADHDDLEARVRQPQGDEHSVHMIHERYSRGITPSVNHQHLRRSQPLAHTLPYEGPTTCRHPFVDCIMEVELPLGWKPLNLKCSDGTTDADEHLNAFLT